VRIEGVEASAGDHAANDNNNNKYDIESRAREVLEDLRTKGVGRLESSRSTGLGIEAQLLCLVGVLRSRRRQGSHVENMDAALAYFLSGPLSTVLY
jgi:hypothetical protein